MELYHILGVRRNATKATIRKAYLRKAKTMHPDQGGDAEEFKKLNHAYQVLYDDARRERYDNTGEESLDTAEEIEERKHIAAIIAQIIINIVTTNEDDLRMTPIFVRLRANMDQKRAGFIASQHGQEKAKRRNRQLRSRVKYNGDGIDFVGAALDNQLVVIEANLENIVKSLEIHDKVQAVLDCYEYMVDTPWGAGQATPQGAPRLAIHDALRLTAFRDSDD